MRTLKDPANSPNLAFLDDRGFFFFRKALFIFK
jgi:hypothetical protein